MFNRLISSAAAVLTLAVMASSVHASSLDIGQLTVNVVDTNGALVANTLGGESLNLQGGALNTDILMNTALTFSANFNSGGVFQNGNFSLTGSALLTSSHGLLENPESLSGTLTSFSETGNALVFGFNVTSAAGPLLASNFGPQGIVQLTITGAPSNFNLGGSFSGGTLASTVDITAVPTPNAGLAGFGLLACCAGFRFLRTRKLV